jgi:hypothetical protein
MANAAEHLRLAGRLYWGRNDWLEQIDSHAARCETLSEESWGILNRIDLPGGGHLGLYQPKHPTALVRAGGQV